MQAQHINCITVGDESKPIVTLGGDLYDRAVKLKDYTDYWCIKPGVLHITMAYLKCLGKYIEGIGLVSAWETAGVYGSATVRQILDVRHIYRYLEAHMMTLLALHTLYQKVVLSEDDLQEVTTQTNKILDAFKSYTVKGATTMECNGVFIIIQSV